jgi:intein-encoded DNA endonuclease-like protein
VEVSAPGSRGGKSSGVAASGPWTRETVCEAEATLQKRVAVEAEAGETRVHALSSQHTRGEGIRKHACLSEEGKGGEMSEIQLRTEGEEEVKKTDNITKTKRRKFLPRELRIKIYNDVHKLRKRGLSHSEIRKEIYRKYGVWISKATISRWLRGASSPYNGMYIPSLKLLKPSEDLGYVIGVRLGDGSTYKHGECHVIYLAAKDKEFVERFAKCLGNVLGRRTPIRTKFRKDDKKNETRYIAEAQSKTLYELLKKPVDLKRIRRYVEHCPKCAAAFLRGLFDSEGHVSKNGYIVLCNTDYDLLVYAQKLLWKYFGIEATGPWPQKPKETVRYNPRTGKQIKANKVCYYIYIRAESLPNFYRYIGFTIKRKQKRLEEYLRRTGKL